MLPSNDILANHARKCVAKAILWIERFRGDYTNEQWAFAAPLLVKDRAITWMRISFGEEQLKNWKAEAFVDSVFPAGIDAFQLWCAYFDRYRLGLGLRPRPAVPTASNHPRAGFYNRMYHRTEKGGK